MRRKREVRLMVTLSVREDVTTKTAIKELRERANNLVHFEHHPDYDDGVRIRKIERA